MKKLHTTAALILALAIICYAGEKKGRCFKAPENVKVAEVLELEKIKEPEEKIKELNKKGWKETDCSTAKPTDLPPPAPMKMTMPMPKPIKK